jgi:hypothetical protein
LKPTGRADAIETQSSDVTMRAEEESMMLLRLRNFLMLVVFGWWTTSLVTMDPFVLEWVAYLLGG